tara:strand:+ start:11058 stop:11393 length:336 start_codon:yes stop_codon:yes gene_type:complete
MKKIYKDIETAKKIYLEAKKSKLEKVELSLIDDVRDLLKRGRNIQKEIKPELNKFNGLLRAGGELTKKFKELEVAAKDLGVDIPNEFKDLQDIAIEMENQGKAIQKAYNLF